MDDLPRLQLDNEESKKWAKEEVRHLQEITGPYLCRMIAEKGPPSLSMSASWMDLLHILLDGPFTHPNIQLEEFSTDALRSPEPIVGRHFFDQGNRLGRELRLSCTRLRCVLPEHTAEFTMPSQKRLWLDNEERLFPGPNHFGQEHQEQPVSFPVDGSFHLSTQDVQLLPQQRVFGQQFSPASGQIGKRAECHGSRQRFDPTQNTILEHAQAETDSLLNRGEDTAQIKPLLCENGRLARMQVQNGQC
jgi:hypothetical protein